MYRGEVQFRKDTQVKKTQDQLTIEGSEEFRVPTIVHPLSILRDRDYG